MNPQTNKFDPLTNAADESNLEQEFWKATSLLRPDGTPVPKHWTVLTVGERVEVKGYTFRVAHIGESHLLLEPTGPVVVGQEDPPST